MDERHRELVKDAQGPWGPRNGDIGGAISEEPAAVQGDDGPVAGAPALNAPWPVLVLVAMLAAAFAAQLFLGDPPFDPFVLTSDALREGRWYVLVTHLFLHGGWLHFGFNAVYALAFASPVARFFGINLRGALVFFAFYMVCGVLAGFGFIADHLQSHVGAVGASGAIAGLMGASSRLMDGSGRLAPILSRNVYSVGGSWVAINLFIAFTGFAPGTNGAVVAWEAHLAGFGAGVLLIGLFARLLPRT